MSDIEIYQIHFCNFGFGCCFSFCLVRLTLFSPEFSYRPGLSVLSEDTNNAVSAHGAGGPPNRPLPPTPDDDDQQGDRTLIMKRVSGFREIHIFNKQKQTKYQ